jgi:hypothetical protein
MWKTIGYRIESASIEQYPRVFRQVWFLDAVQVNPEGRQSASNICSGERDYCQDTLNAIRNQEG